MTTQRERTPRTRRWVAMSAARKRQFLWTWSATKLTTLMRCPAQFYFTYIAPVAVPEPIERMFGKAVHRMCELFFKQNYKSKQTFLRSWGFRWRHMLEVEHEVDSVRWQKAPEEDADMFFKVGCAILSRFWDDNIEVKLAGARPQVERRFHVRFGPFTLLGSIDRIQPLGGDAYEIHDYKTGLRRFREPELRRDLQFTIYQYVEEKRRGERPERLFVHQLTAEESRHIAVPIRSEQDYWTLYQTLAEATSKLIRLLTEAPNPRNYPFVVGTSEDFEQHIFSPNPGSHCNWCVFEETCFASRGETVDPMRRRLAEAALALGRTERKQERGAEQIPFELEFRRRKVHPFLAWKDTKVAKHKRKVGKGKAQLSWDLE